MPEHMKTNWPGSAWIVGLITRMTTRKGRREIVDHLFITSLRTTPDSLL